MPTELCLPKKPENTSQGQLIEIGTSQYLLSAESQSFLDPARITSEYEKTRSVLIINEPHESLAGQINLYKFLEVFFSDNPTLIKKTIFLSEGFPYGKPVSLDPLKKVEPFPNEDTIRTVLGSFLITGYMAYEWKYQYGIPIVGIEDPVLYKLGSKLTTFRFSRQPSKNDQFFQNVSIVARNESMARTLIEATTAFENPMLFVGSGHLSSEIGEEHRKQLFTPGGGVSVPQQDLNILTTTSNKSIHSYLEEVRIGYTLIDSSGQATAVDAEIYSKLFEIQQTENYEEYINWLLSSRRTITTTTKPSPEAAAGFLKKLKESKAGHPSDKDTGDKSEDIKTVEDLSDKSTKEPHIPGFALKIQESLFKEFDARVVAVSRLSKRESNLKTLKFSAAIAPDLPVFGPRIRKDHVIRVDHFATKFANVPGSQEVINLAMAGSWRSRLGSQLQLDAAEIIGPERTRRFEERHLLSEGINRIDIATKENIAVECKNFRRIDAKHINEWVIQGARRFETSRTHHSYKGLIIVIPENIDDKEFKRIEEIFNVYRARYIPEASDKMRLCRLNELLDILDVLEK